MSVSVSIIPPPGFPDPREPISSFARCPGNIMTAPEVLGYVHLDEILTTNVTTAVPRTVLTDVIAELDKGDAGKFSDQWCVDADLRWSGGREAEAAWREIAPFVHFEGRNTPPSMRSKTANWGHVTRERLRDDALRFFLYYAAGYEVRWSP